MKTKIILPSLLLGLSTAISGFAQTPTDWDAGRDLVRNEKPDGGAQETANPNATVHGWSYGYRDTIAGNALTLFTPAGHNNSLGGQPGHEGYEEASTAVGANTTDHNIIFHFCCGPLAPVAPGEMAMGVNFPERNSVVRWTAPSNGTYTYHADWRDIDPNGGDGAAGYVVIKGQQVFGQAWANGVDNGAGTTGTVSLAAGDTIDFMLSPNGDISYDTTRITATVVTVMAPTPPPHGGLSGTMLTVNGSATASGIPASAVLSFVAQQTGHPADLAVKIQYSTSTGPNAIWTDLPNGTSGQMNPDAARTTFYLNTTGYPVQAGLYFRALSSAQSYNNSISNVVGPFDLTTMGNHIGPVAFWLKRNGTLADLSFTAVEGTPPSGVVLQVQSSPTPEVEASWLDVGTMTRSTNATYPNFFLFLANNLPAAQGVYFRAVARLSGSLDSISNLAGPYTLRADVPPLVTLHPPAGLSGSGTQADPLVIAAGSFHFSADAVTDSHRDNSHIVSLKLELDGTTLRSSETGAVALDYSTNVLGLHVLEAIAVDDLGATSRAGSHAFYIQVVPPGDRGPAAAHGFSASSDAVAATAGGSTYTLVTDNGLWTDPTTWRNAAGNNGIPGPNDLAIIGPLRVRLAPVPAPNAEVASLIFRGGTIIGPGNLLVDKQATISSGHTVNMVLIIQAGATCEMINDVDIALGGGTEIRNYGRFFLHGAGGLRTDVFTNHGLTTFQTPLSIPPNAGLDPLASVKILDTGLLANTGNIVGFNLDSLISQDGSGIVSHDGGGIVSHDGGGLVAAGAGNIVSHDGGGLISQDGSGLITQDGAGIVSHDGGGLIVTQASALVAAGAGNLIAAGAGNFHPGAALERASLQAEASSSGFNQTSGETNLSAVTIFGSVTLNGGVLSGTGVVAGDVTNNNGYISPGQTAGLLAITGNFTQGANGSLIIDVGGALPYQLDQLLVGGSAALGGKLDIKLSNGYTPNAADTFNPLGYGSVSGSFATVSSNAQLTKNATGLLLTTNAAIANPPFGQPVNISTRLRVLTSDKVLIGGFIVSGAPGTTKAVLIRGKGPSLSAAGLSGVLSDPLLELHKPGGTVTNDNWADAPNKDRIPSGFAPTSPQESIIIADLPPGNYTVIEKGAHGETGIGLTEIYDLDGSKTVALGNISTRGFVDTGDNVMIGGFIVGGTEPASILVRATGPSLGRAPANLTGVLQDPVLELHDSNGGVIANDDWRATQEAEIIATTVQPADDKEPAILATLVPGNYTAIVRGKDHTTGIAVVEAYKVK